MTNVGFGNSCCDQSTIRHAGRCCKASPILPAESITAGATAQEPVSAVQCGHPDFAAFVIVNRAEDTGRFMADVKIHCSVCEEPFRFKGDIAVGLLADQPSISVDGRELHLPIEPQEGKSILGTGIYQMPPTFAERDALLAQLAVAEERERVLREIIRNVPCRCRTRNVDDEPRTSYKLCGSCEVRTALAEEKP